MKDYLTVSVMLFVFVTTCRWQVRRSKHSHSHSHTQKKTLTLPPDVVGRCLRDEPLAEEPRARLVVQEARDLPGRTSLDLPPNEEFTPRSVARLRVCLLFPCSDRQVVFATAVVYGIQIHLGATPLYGSFSLCLCVSAASSLALSASL